MIKGSGSISLTNGSGSGSMEAQKHVDPVDTDPWRPKNTWIRWIRIHGGPKTRGSAGSGFGPGSATLILSSVLPGHPDAGWWAPDRPPCCPSGRCPPAVPGTPPLFQDTEHNHATSVVEPLWFTAVPVPTLEKFLFPFWIQTIFGTVFKNNKILGTFSMSEAALFPRKSDFIFDFLTFKKFHFMLDPININTARNWNAAVPVCNNVNATRPNYLYECCG